MPIGKSKLKYIYRKLSQSLYDKFVHFKRHSIGLIKFVDVALFVTTILAAIGCLVTIAIYFGFDHTNREYVVLKRCFHISIVIFSFRIFYSWIFRTEGNIRIKNTFLQFIIEIPVIIAFVALIYPHPHNSYISSIDSVFHSTGYVAITLFAYSTIAISLAITRIINKHTNPSLMLSGSFSIIILIGAILLMLPKCNQQPISFIDSLFVSTSAVCITGLTSVDIPTQFTPMGLTILAILIQVGALGVMTFTSFFAMFFSGNSSIFSQIMLKDVIYSRSMSALLPTLLYILGFTLTIEAFGAVAIWFSIHDTIGMTLHDEIIFSLFHSLSSFCNAGFSTLSQGLANPMLLNHNLSIYWITTLLIILGAIGFPILVNAKDAILSKLKMNFGKNIPIPIHLYSMNTKIVILFFSVLFVLGGVLFYMFEQNNTLSGMTLSQQITQSAFNSAVPRSAGFSSVNPANFTSPTLLIVMFLMWVGGGSQSTAGGVKVNTLAAIMYNLKAIVTGSPRVTAFKRSVSIGSIRRANAVVAISIFSYIILSTILVALEPQISPRYLLFEACSALFTVGSSMGITSQLSSASLSVLSVAMFLGRVGIISLLVGVVPQKNKGEARYPTDNIIIN